MKIAVGVLGLLVTLAMAGAARQSDPATLPPGLPPSAGVYLLADSAKWIKLTPGIGCSQDVARSTRTPWSFPSSPKGWAAERVDPVPDRLA